ncbi:hypothetical protein BKI52_16555 [marine bacterium AO1-C]|nr:hypothetical protein BKI52_16555 [marine bacterium AO1-C]
MKTISTTNAIQMMAWLTVLLLTVAMPSMAQRKKRIMKQDTSINNLVHPPGYQTMPIHQIGKVQKFGGGPQEVILIAGLGLASDKVFAQFIKDNSSKYTMYAITLAGYGGTQAYPMPPAGTSYAELTWHKHSQKVILGLMKKYNLKKPVIITNSQTPTLIGLRIALEHPEKIKAIVAIGGELVRKLAPQKLTPKQRQMGIDVQMAPMWFKTVTGETWDSNMWDDLVYSSNAQNGKRLSDEINAVPVPNLLRYMIEHWAYDVTTELDKLKVPVLAIAPGFSKALDDLYPEASKRFYRTAYIDTWKPAGDKVKVVVVKNAGVFVHQDQPAKVNQLVEEFIKR